MCSTMQSVVFSLSAPLPSMLSTDHSKVLFLFFFPSFAFPVKPSISQMLGVQSSTLLQSVKSIGVRSHKGHAATFPLQALLCKMERWK